MDDAGLQVSVEKSGAIERKLTISVASQEIEKQVDKRLQDVARTAKISGFRPGKAPKDIIKKRFGEQVTNEVISETIDSSYRDALGREEIIPAGLIAIDPVPYEPGKDFSYVATLELFPEIPCATLAGQKISKPVVEITDKDVGRTLDEIRAKNPVYVAKDSAKKGASKKAASKKAGASKKKTTAKKSSAAKKGDASEAGDRLTIDFVGTINGEEFAGGKAEGFQFVLAQGQMLEQFESELLGCNKGDKKTIAFTFPENYGGEDIAGKDVEFAVTVQEVERPELPELNDDFAKTLGIAEGGMKKMKQEIRDNLNRELAARLRMTMRDRVMDALYAANDIEIPKALLEQEIDRAVQNITQQLESQQLATDNIDRSVHADDAKKRVALGLIAREIVDKYEINVDEAAIRAKAAEMAKSYEDSEAYVNGCMSNPEQRQQIEAIAIEEHIIEKMLETAKITERKMSFQDFMNPQPKK